LLNSQRNQNNLPNAGAPALPESAAWNHAVAIPASADHSILIDVASPILDCVNATLPNYGSALSMKATARGTSHEFRLHQMPALFQIASVSIIRFHVLVELHRLF
jgi:hypothetical protein